MQNPKLIIHKQGDKLSYIVHKRQDQHFSLLSPWGAFYNQHWLKGTTVHIVTYQMHLAKATVERRFKGRKIAYLQPFNLSQLVSTTMLLAQTMTTMHKQNKDEVASVQKELGEEVIMSPKWRIWSIMKFWKFDFILFVWPQNHIQNVSMGFSENKLAHSKGQRASYRTDCKAHRGILYVCTQFNMNI